MLPALLVLLGLLILWFVLLTRTELERRDLGGLRGRAGGDGGGAGGAGVVSRAALLALLALSACTMHSTSFDGHCAVNWNPGVNGPCVQWTWTPVAVPTPPTDPWLVALGQLTVRTEPSSRTGYDRDDYGSGHSSKEDDVIRTVPQSGGRVFTPYTCTAYDIRADGTAATDIDHSVALAEAHDSGIRASRRREFGADLDNLTIAVPSVNRNRKSDNDAAEWSPERNRGWFAARVVAVKQEYGLSVDPAERDSLAAMLVADTSRTRRQAAGLSSWRSRRSSTARGTSSWGHVC